MGQLLFDRFTYLHFASGIIAYFFDLSLLQFIILHTIFEIIENTKFGINFINKYLFSWPGGKSDSDRIINNIGDTIGALIGWLSAYLISYNSLKIQK